MFRRDLIPFENAKIKFVDEVFAIEKPGTQLNVHRLTAAASGTMATTSDDQQPLSQFCFTVFIYLFNYLFS